MGSSMVCVLVNEALSLARHYVNFLNQYNGMVMSKHPILAIAVIITAAAFWAAPAHAYGPEGLFGGRPNPDNSITIDNPVQTDVRPERAQSVLEHPRPDYDADPIPFYSFDLYPSLEAGMSYANNIYATPTDQKRDLIETVHPAINALSNWGRHSLAITASGDINTFDEHPKENYNNGIFGVNGRYDIMNQTWVSGRGGLQYLSEPRNSPNADNGSKPTSFAVYSLGTSFYRGAGVVQTQADYDFKRYEYNATPFTGGLFPQSFRNRDQHVIGDKVFYAYSENVKPYISGHYNIRQYDANAQRDSHGYDFNGGALMDFGGITTLDTYIGWISQNYKNYPTRNVNDGVNFGGRFLWNVTGLTTLVLESNRTIEESTIAAYNSFKSTGGSATLTHELMRNLILEADMAYVRENFQGTGQRQDDIVSAGGGARVLISKNLYTDVDYTYSHRISDQVDQAYVQHVVTARIGSHF